MKKDNLIVSVMFLLVLIVAIAALKSVINECNVEIEKARKENVNLVMQNKILTKTVLNDQSEKEELLNQIKKLKEEIEELRTIRAKVTAYAPLDNKSGICADATPMITATGKRASRGIVAVNPRRIPYGTKLYIPGYGQAVAEDTGGAIRNYDGVAIDVLVDSYEEARRWGVKYIDVKIGGKRD